MEELGKGRTQSSLSDESLSARNDSTTNKYMLEAVVLKRQAFEQEHPLFLILQTE
jgi:hypothetical protein